MYNAHDAAARTQASAHPLKPAGLPLPCRAVNVLAPFLLTALLLDRVTDRIINVSSVSAGSSIDFDNLQQVGGTRNKIFFCECWLGGQHRQRLAACASSLVRCPNSPRAALWVLGLLTNPLSAATAGAQL